MKENKLLFFVAAIFLVFTAYAPQCDAINATVKWKEPLLNVNGKPIVDLEGFFLYLSESQDTDIPQVMTIDKCNDDPQCIFVKSNTNSPKGDVMEYTFVGLERKRYFLRIVAIDEIPNYDVKTEYKDLSKPPVLGKDDIAFPVDEPATVSSCYGWREIDKGTEWHEGIDISVGVGTPVRAVADGTIIQTCHARFNYFKDGVKECGGFGGFVYMKHDDLGTYSQYSHLSEEKVVAGQKVKRGDIIGLSGDTGRSTGPHLDFRYFLNSRRNNKDKNPAANPLCYLPSDNLAFNAKSCNDADGTGAQFCPGS